MLSNYAFKNVLSRRKWTYSKHGPEAGYGQAPQFRLRGLKRGDELPKRKVRVNQKGGYDFLMKGRFDFEVK